MKFFSTSMSSPNSYFPLLTLLSRRDGSPFMNLLMTAPLCDSRGTIRYFIGAQVDVSGLVKECSDMESLSRLIATSDEANVDTNTDFGKPAKDEFQELSEMLNLQELETVRRWVRHCLPDVHYSHI